MSWLTFTQRLVTGAPTSVIDGIIFNPPHFKARASLNWTRVRWGARRRVAGRYLHQSVGAEFVQHDGAARRRSIDISPGCGVRYGKRVRARQGDRNHGVEALVDFPVEISGMKPTISPQRLGGRVTPRRGRGFVLSIRISLTLYVMLISLAAASIPARSGTDRRFTVADSIHYARFVTPREPTNQGPGSPVAFSPNRKYLVAVTIRGDVRSGMRTSTLWLFSSAEVNAWLQQQNIGQLLKAHPLLRMANDSNELPISQWRWSGDSGSLLFLAGDDDGVEHLYRVFIDGKLEMISRPNQSVYGFSENADALVYCAGRAIRSSQLYQAAGPTLGDMEDGTGRSSAALLFPNLLRVWFHTDDCRLWKMSASGAVRAGAGYVSATRSDLSRRQCQAYSGGRWATIAHDHRREAYPWVVETVSRHYWIQRPTRLGAAE